jgi:hypothetical protein
MTKIRLPQPRFSIIVRRPNGDNATDITIDVDSVTLEIDQNMISVLTFELKNPEKYESWLDRSYRVDFYGGYLTTKDYYTELPNNEFDYRPGSTNEHFRYMFNGTIWQLKYKYYEDGTKNVSIVAKDMSWGAAAKDNKYAAYPSKDCPRSWANKQSLKLSEIVKKIAEDIGMSVTTVNPDGTEVSTIQISNDVEYTLKKPAVQYGNSDWSFLNKLAKNNACYMWTNIDPVTGDYTLYFIDKGKAIDAEERRIEFVWLDRKDNFDFKQGEYLPIGDEVSETTKLKNNQIQIKSIEVDVAQAAIGSSVVEVTTFNDLGQEETKLVSYEEDADNIIYWDLDEKKVEAFTRNNPKEADRLLNMGPTNIPREDFEKFYTPVKIPKNAINAIDRPFLGIDVTAKIDGNVNIEPFQSYRIYGIGRWSSRKSSKVLRYYLYSITHTWDSNGFETELKFKA